METATAPHDHPRTPTPGGPKAPWRLRAVGALLGVLLIATGYLAYTLLHDSPRPSAETVRADWARPSVSAADLPDRLGVRLTQVAVTGDGGLLDLRFQVVDPEKAAQIHAATTPPAIVEERSGLFIDDLLMGHSHSGAFKPAVSYYLIFVNDGNLVRRGSTVTVLLGGVQVEHVVVR